MEVRWDAGRPAALIVRGHVSEGPVYVARILGTDRVHGFAREFIGESRLTHQGRIEEITVATSALRASEILEIRDGTPLEKVGMYERFLTWDGSRFTRIEMSYALHALQRAVAARTSQK